MPRVRSPRRPRLPDRERHSVRRRARRDRSLYAITCPVHGVDTTTRNTRRVRGFREEHGDCDGSTVEFYDQ